MSHAHDQEIHPEPTGFFRKYIWSYDHKMIGKQYLVTSFIFLLLGGALALLMRWQLAYPGKAVAIWGLPIGEWLAGTFVFNAAGAVSEDGYIQLVTMHGSVMVFFVIIPLLVGAFGNYLIPLHVGARDVAFPLLNALSYWLYFAACVVLVISMIPSVSPQGMAAAGWTSYPPLSGLATPGAGQTIWLFSLFLIGFSSIVGGLNFLTTIVFLRAPGMTWSRLPLLTWAQLTTALFQTLATPVLASALCLLMVDRIFGTSFFIPANIGFPGAQNTGGGHPLLWQHIFWFYSHPAVYILILPGMGIASEILSVFARKPIFGYKAMAIAMAAIMGLGFIVWGHHMFISGMSPQMGMAFMITTMLIAMPSGVKVFNWLATLWGGAIRFTVPMLCAVAFVSMFIIGGLSGIFMAATPVDIFIHDTYYVVAHFHYVVFGGTLFAVFGGIYYWFPKMFGRMMNNTLGVVHWALTFIGFNLAFFPMHFLGEAGFLRRYSDHVQVENFVPLQPMNVFITHAAFLLGFSQLIFIFNFFWSMYKGRRAEANPWQANTLEWSIPSPPPYHNFDVVPTVYHGPYEYSSPLSGNKDWLRQDEKGPGPASPQPHARASVHA